MKHLLRGFTLLEVLIALSLTGLLVAFLGSSLVGTRTTLNMSENLSARLDEVRTAQVFLRQALQQSLPLPVTDTDQDTGWTFKGQAQQLSFVAAMPLGLNGGVKIHTLALTRASSQFSDLQISFHAYNDPDDRPWGEPQRLLREVSNLKISYRGKDEHQQESKWLMVWPWPHRLPHYVRIDLDAHGPVRWHPLIVALRNNLEVGEVAP